MYIKNVVHYSGVHRSGKTTAAKDYASNTGNIFIDTNFSDITGCKGFSDKPRIDTQIELFEHMSSIYLSILRYKTKKDFILDRSMLDILAYSLYYKLPEDHIKYLWYRIVDHYSLLFKSGFIPTHVFYDHPLVDFAKPEDVTKYQTFFDCFKAVKQLFFNYAQRQDYYL